MAEKASNKQCMKVDESNYQITIFKEDDELIARIFKDNCEVKAIVKDGYIIDIKRLAS